MMNNKKEIRIKRVFRHQEIIATPNRVINNITKIQ